MIRSRQVSLGAVIWVVIGVIVASGHGFFTHLMTLTQILSAIMAVLLWPLVLLKVHVGI